MNTTKITCIVALLVANTFVFGQAVTVTPEYDTPEKNIWNGAIYTGLDLQNATGGVFVGLHGRYTMGKVATFSTNLSYDLTRLVGSGSLLSFDEELLGQLPAYKDFQFRGSFHFQDKIGELSSKVKLGRRNESTPTGGGKTVKYSTDYSSKVRNVFGITASVNIQSRLAGNQDSTQVITVKDAQGNDPGNIKVAVGQNNLVLGAGLQIGQYTWFKGNFSAPSANINKNKRIRKSIIANFELLYAMTISTGDIAYFKQEGQSTLVEYNLVDVEKKRLGFRLTTDMASNKPGGFQRIELGWRPGVWAPSRSSKFLNQAYLVYGIGIAF